MTNNVEPNNPGDFPPAPPVFPPADTTSAYAEPTISDADSDLYIAPAGTGSDSTGGGLKDKAAQVGGHATQEGKRVAGVAKQ
ncbi:MAG: hypothetical protein JWP30_601, partial [Homoserinimonas sp.]|nr:hypothetical protein [Homoserinimonas sp.]